jgi:hypothetical protein
MSRRPVKKLSHIKEVIEGVGVKLERDLISVKRVGNLEATVPRPNMVVSEHNSASVEQIARI